MRRLILVYPIVALVSFLFLFNNADCARAGEVRSLSLEECIHLAFKSNTDLRKDRLNRRISLLDRRIGEDYFLPDLYLTPGMDYRTDEDGRARFMLGAELSQQIPTGGELTLKWNESYNRYTGYGDEEDWTSKFSVKLTQPLLRGAGLKVGTAPVVLARLDDDYDLNSYLWLITQRITQVEKKYWSLAEAEQNLTLAQAFLDDTRSMARKIASRTGVEDDPEWRAEIANRELDIAEAQQDRTEANLALLDLLDLDGVDQVRTTTRLWNKPMDKHRALEEHLNLALAQRPDLKRASVYVESTRLRAQVAESNALQDVDLAVEASTTGTEDRLGDSIHDAFDLEEEFVVSLGAEIRFGVPGRKRSAIAAQYTHQKAKLDYLERKQSVENDVVTALGALKTSHQSFLKAVDVERLARLKLEAALKKLDAGGADNLKLIIYQRDLNTAQSRVHQAALDYLNDLADLNEATGSTIAKWGLEVVLKADD